MAGDAAPPRTSEALVERLDRASERFVLAWLEGSTRVRVERLDGVALPSRPEQPEVDFMNRVIGLRSSHGHLVTRIAGHYARLGVRPWFELSPAPGFRALAERLTAVGAAQIDMDVILAGPPHGRPAAPPGVEVRRLEADAVETFARTLLAGHGLSGADLEEALVDLRHWPRVPGLELYLALLEGRPAAAAALAIDDGVGYLASASTLPALRGRGCHAALIGARIAAARRAGCDVVSSQTRFFSTSQRNLERAGLRPLYAKAVWRVLAPGSTPCRAAGAAS